MKCAFLKICCEMTGAIFGLDFGEIRHQKAKDRTHLGKRSQIGLHGNFSQQDLTFLNINGGNYRR